MTDIKSSDTTKFVQSTSSVQTAAPQSQGPSNASFVSNTETKRTLKNAQNNQKTPRERRADNAQNTQSSATRDIKKQTADQATKVTGKVISHSPDNPRQYTVETQYGNVTLQSEAALPQRPPIDSAITLSIRTEQSSAQAYEQTINITLSDADAPQADLPPVRPEYLRLQLTPLPQENFITPLPQDGYLNTLTAITLSPDIALPPTQDIPSPAIISNTALSLLKALMPMINDLNAQHSVLKPALLSPLIQTSAQASPASTISTLTTTLSQLPGAASTINLMINSGDVSTLAQRPTATSTLMQLHTPQTTRAETSFSPAPTVPHLHNLRSTPLKAGEALVHVSVQNNNGSTQQVITQVTASGQASGNYHSIYSSDQSLITLGTSFLLPASTDGTLLLANGTLLTATPITAGSDTSMANQPALPVIPAAQLATPILGPLLHQAQPWDSLQQLHTTLSQISPQHAATLASTTATTSNAQTMMPAALFFLSAIKGGDISEWLGNKTIDILKKAGKTDALNRLLSESSALSRMAQEPAQDWRTYAMPLRHNDDFHKIALHTREDTQGEDNKNNKEQSTRFVFDLSLDNIGDVQLDGLFSGQRLDLILRTGNHFSKPHQQEMKRLYAQALGSSNIYGELNFQTKSDHWVTILAQEVDNKIIKNI